MVKVEVKRNVKEENNRIAEEFRQKCTKQGTLVVNVMGSVGAGKTSLLEEIAKAFGQEQQKMAVVNADLATSIDSDRIARWGVPTTQINTGRGCHLNALQVQEALPNLNIDGLEYLFIENVGNTICPSGWDIGAHIRLVVTSTTEGPYVVEKHPFTFKNATVIVFNKMDLAEVMEVKREKLEADAKNMSPRAKVLFTSVKTGEGIKDLLSLLQDYRKQMLEGVPLREAQV